MNNIIEIIKNVDKSPVSTGVALEISEVENKEGLAILEETLRYLNR
jgi:hypothetical protein